MIAEVLNDVGCATTRSDLSRALEAFELSLRLRRELGDMVNVADSLNNIGYALVIAEAPDEARPPLMESYALAKSLGSVRHEALAVGNLAIVSLLDGSLERARAEFAECIDLSERLVMSASPWRRCAALQLWLLSRRITSVQPRSLARWTPGTVLSGASPRPASG